MVIKASDVTKKTFGTHRVTSIGRSVNSVPKNRHKRRNWKPYQGQGK